MAILADRGEIAKSRSRDIELQSRQIARDR